MRKTAALIATLALTLATFAAAPADAASCTIHGANKATWGCGHMTSTRRGGGSIQLQDTKTNGRCVRVQVRNEAGRWTDQGINHCSGHPSGSYGIRPSGGGDVTGVRIKDGWTGRYLTINY